MNANDITGLLPLLALFLVFYFLILRPARTRQRQVADLQRSLEVGQEVITTSGLHGRIIALDETAPSSGPAPLTAVLEVAPGVHTRWERAAIGAVVDAGADDASAGEALADAPAEVPQNGPSSSAGSTATTR